MRQERMTVLPPFDPSGIVSGADPILATHRGWLFNEDCLAFLNRVEDESIDTIFADPPFNLGKVYGSKVNDRLSQDEYIAWGKSWIDECIRVLKPGGYLYLQECYNDANPIVLPLQPPQMERRVRSSPDLSRHGVQALDCDQYEGRFAYPWPLVSSALQLALLRKGQARYLS